MKLMRKQIGGGAFDSERAARRYSLSSRLAGRERAFLIGNGSEYSLMVRSRTSLRLPKELTKVYNSPDYSIPRKI